MVIKTSTLKRGRKKKKPGGRNYGIGSILLIYLGIQVVLMLLNIPIENEGLIIWTVWVLVTVAVIWLNYRSESDDQYVSIKERFDHFDRSDNYTGYTERDTGQHFFKRGDSRSAKKEAIFFTLIFISITIFVLASRN